MVESTARTTSKYPLPLTINQEPKRTHKPKNRTNSTKEFSEQFEGAIGSIPSQTRVLRQIAPESSPERSAKSLSHSFFVVPCLPLTINMLQSEPVELKRGFHKIKAGASLQARICQATFFRRGKLVTNPGTTPITILAVNSDHGLSFAREETRTMV